MMRQPCPRRAARLAVLAPAAMTGAFATLSRIFDYPAVIDLPPEQVLARAAAAGPATTACWALATACGPLLSALAADMHPVLKAADPPRRGHRARRSTVGTASGILAGLCMTVDLAQWVWLYPHLGRAWARAGDAGTRQHLVSLQAAWHHRVGVGVGIEAATVLSGLWALAAARAMRDGDRYERMLSRAGTAAGVLFWASIAPGVDFTGYTHLQEAATALWLTWLVGWGLYTLHRSGPQPGEPAPTGPAVSVGA
jgi:hypothetical protein